MGAQGAKFFNGQSYFRHDELPALLDCFAVDAVVSRDRFAARQKHAADGNPDDLSPPPQAGHAMASARFGAVVDQAYATTTVLTAASPRARAAITDDRRRRFFDPSEYSIPKNAKSSAPTTCRIFATAMAPIVVLRLDRSHKSRN